MARTGALVHWSWEAEPLERVIWSSTRCSASLLPVSDASPVPSRSRAAAFFTTASVSSSSATARLTACSWNHAISALRGHALTTHLTVQDAPQSRLKGSAKMDLLRRHTIRGAPHRSIHEIRSPKLSTASPECKATRLGEKSCSKTAVAVLE